jgi:alpha-glucuronidase
MTQGKHSKQDRFLRCPIKNLLWFHNLPWTHPMPKPTNYTPDAEATPANAISVAAAAAGGGGVNDTITLYEYIRFTHFHAVEQAKGLAAQWDTLEGLVDEQRHKGVKARFAQQVRDATQMAHDIMVQYTRWSKQAGAV